MRDSYVRDSYVCDSYVRGSYVRDSYVCITHIPFYCKLIIVLQDVHTCLRFGSKRARHQIELLLQSFGPRTVVSNQCVRRTHTHQTHTPQGLVRWPTCTLSSSRRAKQRSVDACRAVAVRMTRRSRLVLLAPQRLCPKVLTSSR